MTVYYNLVDFSFLTIFIILISSLFTISLWFDT